MDSARSQAPFYLHGYSASEQSRLKAQGSFLEEYVYPFIDLSTTKRLLEVGCGVGAQTEVLLRRFPALRITAVDHEPMQIQKASRGFSREATQGRVVWEVADAERLPYPRDSFDGAFLCWVLEHVKAPQKVVNEVFRVLSSGGVLYATEVFNDPFYVYPHSPAIVQYWRAYCNYQSAIGGHPNIGAALYDIFSRAGFQNIETHTITYQFDSRIAACKRNSFFEYWKSLFLSASHGLLSRRLQACDVEAMLSEFDTLKAHPGALFFLTASQARGVK